MSNENLAESGQDAEKKIFMDLFSKWRIAV